MNKIIKTFEYNNQIYSYTLNIDKKFKHLTLKCDKNMKLLVNAPININIDYINQFLKEKAAKVLVFREKKLKNNPFNFQKGYIHIFGVKFLIQKNLTLKEKIQIELKTLNEHRYLILHLPNKDFHDYEKQEKVVLRFLKKQATIFIPPMVAKFCLKFNLTIPKIQIRTMNRKWGWCSTKNIICFNSKLICWEISIIEYVICHELAHLTYMDHSKNFWSLVAQYDPDYEIALKKLAYSLPID